ncbi:hypothetical protein K4K54_002402 [Colletotrichum sp. SAR 10_86]|nr:hypothetical protein K4K50_010925 [Colletotrichum sp. SAR 10_71]KAI8153548.1 hypothetical protein KHU50_011061 [Colletotrichum sp. SAR 10_65]KAI8172697.1 hypothetical protein K4K51_010724 [Colletotrichum sp. SAR 10_75]KAI8228153.1 hypothetical protein K4K54_002402 [Colletotrichum sp. SAR 10_86]KAI8249066.1 hypothetical protein K4K53_000337 [Colletotrichum sp. SAR 10_77]
MGLFIDSATNDPSPDLASSLETFVDTIQTQQNQIYECLKGFESELLHSPNSHRITPCDLRRLLPSHVLDIILPALPVAKFTLGSNGRNINGKLQKTAKFWDLNPIQILFAIGFDYKPQGQGFFIALLNLAAALPHQFDTAIAQLRLFVNFGSPTTDKVPFENIYNPEPDNTPVYDARDDPSYNSEESHLDSNRTKFPASEPDPADDIDPADNLGPPEELSFHIKAASQDLSLPKPGPTQPLKQEQKLVMAGSIGGIAMPRGIKRTRQEYDPQHVRTLVRPETPVQAEWLDQACQDVFGVMAPSMSYVGPSDFHALVKPDARPSLRIAEYIWNSTLTVLMIHLEPDQWAVAALHHRQELAHSVNLFNPMPSSASFTKAMDSDNENSSDNGINAFIASRQHQNDWWNRRQELFTTWLQEQDSVLQPSHEGVMSAIDAVEEVQANAERLVNFYKENLDKVNRMQAFGPDESPGASHDKKRLDELVAANKDTASMVAQLRSTSKGLKTLMEKTQEFKQKLAQQQAFIQATK